MRTQNSQNFHSKGSDPYISSGTCVEAMQGEKVRGSKEKLYTSFK